MIVAMHIYLLPGCLCDGLYSFGLNTRSRCEVETRCAHVFVKFYVYALKNIWLAPRPREAVYQVTSLAIPSISYIAPIQSHILLLLRLVVISPVVLIHKP